MTYLIWIHFKTFENMVGDTQFKEEFRSQSPVTFVKVKLAIWSSRLGNKCHGRYFNIGYDHNGMTWDLNCLSPCIFEKVVSPASSSSGTYSF